MTTREFTDQEIESFVHDLESLQGGLMASAALICCGARAIPPLQRFLLRSKPRGVFQPRQLAVETLAELGAKDVLMEYLQEPSLIKDPVVRFGENAVKSTAARELARWPAEDVFQCLMRAGLDHLLSGIVETLGTFRRTEAMPYFLWALGDDVCRSPAEAAIRKLKGEARPFLIDAARISSPSREEETPSSLRRRRSALRLLCDLKIPPQEWTKLRDSLEENDAEIVITTARIGLQVAPTPEKLHAVRRLIEMLPRVDWFLRSDAREALVAHFDIAREAIEDEIARRTASAEKDRGFDVVLRVLLNLRNQAMDPGLARR